MTPLARLAIVAVLMVGSVACGDSGPKGPGSFVATVAVVGPAPGAVVIHVTGAGLRSFEGTGDTQLFATELASVDGVRRLVAVSASGTIGFRVNVDKVELGFPVAVVTDAAGTDNLPRGPAGLTVEFFN
jgi:hypothetical protein